ncbi:Proline/betaine transporter [compost metagenome]
MASVGVLMGMYGSAPFCMMTELFPTRTRYSAMSVGYNVAMVLFGGTAPLISASLTKLTGNPSSPAYFMMGGAVLSIFAILASPETSRVPIDELGQSDEHIRRVRMALKASARVE